MKIEYRFPSIPELSHLSVFVENNGRRLSTRIHGRCSPKLWFLIKWYFESFSWIKPLAFSKKGVFYSLYLPPIPSLAHARMFSSTISSIYMKSPLPIAVTIGVTNDCQYNCVHCSAAGRSTSIPVLSIDELRVVVKDCLDLGVANITFTGGEPLLRKDLETCVASVPSHLATSQVFSNALDLSKTRARSLKQAGLHGMQISLDSPNPEAHDRLRGMKGAFQAVKAGVQNALGEGLYVGISTYATKESATNRTLYQMADLCAEWGVHEITVFDAISTGRQKEQSTELLDEHSRKILIADGKILNRRYRGKMRVVTQSWTNSGKGFARIIGCLAAHMQFHITAQGDFTPCDFTPLSIGNVRQNKVKDIWNTLIHHPEYCHHSLKCRMQDPVFRSKYIDTIPEGSSMPCPIHDNQDCISR